MGKDFNKEKKKKKIKKDEENVLSKDIDVEEEMKFLEKMNEKSGIQREMSNINYSKSFVKNLKFKPYKYKGTYLPYHLRWIFGNQIKTNEISLVQEIKALETEILRLKQQKLLNREFRKIAGLSQLNPNVKLCVCCKKVEPKNHLCSHSFCEENCIRKKVENQYNNTFSLRTTTTNRNIKGLYDNKLTFGSFSTGNDIEPKKMKLYFATKRNNLIFEIEKVKRISSSQIVSKTD